MQIDGHHTATYVAARIAGFSFTEAAKIAYAAQYVDDATNGGVVLFLDSDYMYSRIASAHKMVDYNNLVDVENHLAWIPFHFLPGNGGLPAGEEPEGGELAKLVCRPDSHVARDMLRACAKDMGTPRGLHRLGIAMHVYADTFAHQGFVGALHHANQASDVTSGDVKLDKRIRNKTRWELLWASVRNAKAFGQLVLKAIATIWHEKRLPVDYFVDFVQRKPVGHAAADVYPDQPYLAWRYTDHTGTVIERDNPAIFVQAVDQMVRVMRAWRAGDVAMAIDSHHGLDEKSRSVVDRLFRTNTYIDGEERRRAWLHAISSGEFDFGNEIPTYVGKGQGSWKEIAIGTEKVADSGYERFGFKTEFIHSDWKLFHDALQAHRSAVIHDVLPRYGICAA